MWGEYGGSYGIGANAWSPDHVSVSDGTLRIKMDRQSSQGKPYTSGGAATWGLAQTYGRYEFQAMAPAVPGIDSYVTLQPPDGDSDKDSMLVEILDKPAVSPGLQAAYVTINYGSGKTDQSVPGAYCGAFHDYVIEWTPTYESVSVDGKVLLKSSGSSSAKQWIGFVMSNGDTLTGTPSASAPLPAEFDIRHLRIYAYSPGAPGSTSAPTTQASTTSHAPSSASATSATSMAPAKPTSATGATTAATPTVPGSTASAPSTPIAPSSASSSVVLADQNAAHTAHGGGSGPLLVAGGLTAAALAGGAVVFVRRTRGRGSRGAGSR